MTSKRPVIFCYHDTSRLLSGLDKNGDKSVIDVIISISHEQFATEPRGGIDLAKVSVSWP